MSSNLSLGPLQVHDNSVGSINLALGEVMNRLDAIQGLRGRASVFDRVRVSTPVEAEDALNLGELSETEAGSVASIPFLSTFGVGIVSFQPGTTHIELSPNLRQRVNFASPRNLDARVIVSGWGTGAGTGKGVAITTTSGTVIAEVLWNGNAEGLQVGNFTAVTLSTDQVVHLRVKGSTAEESLILRAVIFDLRYEATVVTF